MRGNLTIFCTRSMQHYSDNIIQYLKTNPAYKSLKNRKNIDGKLIVTRFADGEMEVETTRSVRGKDVFLIANSSRNRLGISVEENKIETYHAIDALRRAQAERIILLEPYCSSSRSDRTTRRNSVGIWVHFKTLISLGVDHIITFELHSDKSKTAVDPAQCAIDDIPAMSLIMKYIADEFVGSLDALLTTVKNNWVFCSVDAGGEELAKIFATSFNTPLAIAHKQRNYGEANKVETVTILSNTDLKNKTVWIIDDMVDTGSSIYKLAYELKKREVAVVNIAAFHPVFSPPALDRLKELNENNLIDNLIVTDSIECDPRTECRIKRLKIVPSFELAAEIIFRLNSDTSMSDLFDPINAYEYLSKNKKGK